MRIPRKPSRLLIVAASVTGILGMSQAPAGAAQYTAGRYVATSMLHSCEWAWNSITFDGNTLKASFTSEAIVDGPDYCGNKQHSSPPGRLSFEQDIWSVASNTLCNKGPRIANDGYWAYGLITSWTTTVKGLYKAGTWCGSAGTYFIRTTVYDLDEWTGLWTGGYMDGPQVALY